VRSAALLLLLLIAGCRDPGVGPDQALVRGAIEHYGNPIIITAAFTATAGVPYSVKVLTYGGGCVSKGETELQVTGQTALIEPYDLERRGSACTDELRVHEHIAAVRFEQRGEAIVIVRGRSEPSGQTIDHRFTVFVN
jgi:hypothetical protein